MNQFLCSTGALLGKPNNRNYRLLEEMASKLECDGFEFMVYGSWYPKIDELIACVKAMHLNIPVIHCQKSLGEALCGIKIWQEGNNFSEYIMTEKEDEACYAQGKEKFLINLKVANAFGAEKMVLHLWNGLPSDRNIQKNIERYGELNDMAKKAGVMLMVENVICNTNNPLYDMELLYKNYPDVVFVYDTKMAEFHRQTMKIFEPEWEWIVKEGHIKHLHVNDYNGGYMDWGNFGVLPIGKGHVDFDEFFKKFYMYGYSGDYTIEATAFDRSTGEIDFAMLNDCLADLRQLVRKYGGL